MGDDFYHYAMLAIVGVTVGIRLGCDLNEGTRFHFLPQDRETSIPALAMTGVLGILCILQVVFGVVPFPIQVAAPADEYARLVGLVTSVLAGVMITWPRLMRHRRKVWTSPYVSPLRIHGHVLVTWGPYRYIRHPFYGGVILAFVGINLTMLSWLLLLAPVVAVAIASGLADEEDLLRKAYGSAYDTYASRTWRLLPLVY